MHRGGERPSAGARTADARRRAIVAADAAHVWRPYAVAEVDPLVVAHARGAWLFDVDGKRYLDGNSSWWVAALGHGHPRLLATLRAQAETLAHCALAGITHEPAALLAEDLIAVAPPGLSRVFYTDNGSTSIEVAVKIAVQHWQLRGAPRKTRFVALDGAFHGDTIGASSLGGVEVFRRPFAGVLFECARAPFPDEAGFARAFEALERIVRDGADTIAAVVVEPVVQGAAGMRVYAPAYLRALREVCDRHEVLLIVDEVFTGYGRTGPMWACAHAGITPDMMCLGKVFASILPMGATLVREAVHEPFRAGKGSALFYGHTFCGHPLGAALAREVLAIYRDEDVLGQVARKAPRIARAVAALTGAPGVAATRAMGMIGAVDLEGERGYLGQLGWHVHDEARRQGVYLRPLGNTVYVCPPLVIEEEDLDTLLATMVASITAVTAAAARGA